MPGEDIKTTSFHVVACTHRGKHCAVLLQSFGGAPGQDDDAALDLARAVIDAVEHVGDYGVRGGLDGTAAKAVEIGNVVLETPAGNQPLHRRAEQADQILPGLRFGALDGEPHAQPLEHFPHVVYLENLGQVEPRDDRAAITDALDQAALKILRLAAPFPPLPPDIRKDYDTLRFAYEWDFSKGAAEAR